MAARARSRPARPRRWAELSARAGAAIVGRRNLVRLLRALEDEARLDTPNVAEYNGEGLIQSAVATRAADELTVFDVGANIGEWTASLVGRWRPGHGRLTIHAFEPSAYTYRRLADTVNGMGRAGVAIHCHNVGMSNVAATVPLFIPHPGAGSSSLYPRPDGANGSKLSESVELLTIDGFCVTSGIHRIDYLKCDAEGHDLAVLEGAEGLLSAGAIGVAQFEYNSRWVDARRYLRDAFGLADANSYQVGKLTPIGVEAYPTWDPELESFREGNYVFYRRPEDLGVNVFPWWKVAS